MKLNIIKSLIFLLVSIHILNAVYLQLGSELTYEGVAHKLKEGYIVEDSGINKNFISTDTTTSSNWDYSGGSIFLLNFNLRPINNLILFSEFKFIYGYADRYWFTINDEHRLFNNKEFFRWTKAEVKYQITGLNLRYFKGIGHYHWGNEGDMFNLYPEQYEEQKYLRVSGRAIPEGFELNYNSSFGKFTLVAGPELVWGFKDGALLKYNFKISGIDNTFIYKYEKIPYYNDYVLNTLHLSSKAKIYSGCYLQAGLLFRPFKISEEYKFVKEVSEGTGILGSKYLLGSNTVDYLDAIATKFKLNTFLLKPYLDDITFITTFAGSVAGNKNEFEFQISKSINRIYSVFVDYLYRSPIYKPLPLLYEGTQDNKGPIIISPRGPESPFVVDWSNREASIASFIFNFDPTPQTWFYRYQPNIVDDWNLNPQEDATFACAVRYSLEYYPTTTDRLYFYDEKGNIVWEDPYSAGCWATKRPLNSLKILSRLNFLGVGLVLSLATGESLATGGVSYTTSEEKNKPITVYFSCGFNIIKDKFSAKFVYTKNNWGPEDWHRTFGQTIDSLYQFGINYSILNFLYMSLDYVSVNEEDNKFISGLGSYDEIKFTTTIKFSKNFSF